MMRPGFREFQACLSSLSKLTFSSNNPFHICKNCQQSLFVSKRSRRQFTTIVNSCLAFATSDASTCIGVSRNAVSHSNVALGWGDKTVRLLSTINSPPPPTPSKENVKREELSAPNVLDQVKASAELSAEVEKRKNKLLKVIPKMRKDASLDYKYTRNIYILPSRAVSEYLLKLSDLENLPKYSRRSPYAIGDRITLYLRSEVEEVALLKWGTFDKLNKERAKLSQGDVGKYDKLDLSTFLGDTSHRYASSNPDDPAARAMAEGKKSSDNTTKDPTFLSSGSTKVVMSAIVINGANALLKLIAWLYSGSHSMFSEFIHSLADTMNQIVLAVGLYHSFKKPDTDHPYGYSNLRHISSLISGVGIFFLGTGLSWYHSVQGFMHPTELGSLTWCIATLVGSLISEGATLLIAINQIHKSCKAVDMSFKEYAQSGVDPNVTVVLLEDLAAVVGVGIAGVCISITHLTGSPTADALGSALIGTLLGGVAGFIIYNNTTQLVGRSIPLDERHEISQLLETDRMIRSLHDIKATQMGGLVRYKAEVDFDGREITRAYLYKQDLDIMLAEANNLKTVEDLELFMLNHGEKVIDTLGGEVDRIEKALQSKHPEIRHVDLEAL